MKTTLLLAPDAEPGKPAAVDSPEIASLKKQLAAAQAEIAALKKIAVTPEMEKAIISRMTLGLSREQAEQVVRENAAWLENPEHPNNLPAGPKAKSRK